MKTLKKYKYLILTNLYIYLSYVFIPTIPKSFGIDDIRANQYIYCPNCSIKDNISNIYHRVIDWNSRIGELIYFIIGCFPKWIYYILNGFQYLLFANLVYIFLYGKNSKKYLFTKKYIIIILLSFLFTITLFPGFSEVFIWMAGTFNHLFNFNVILLCALPFRLLLDDINIFKSNKKRIILYIFISFIAGFTIENVVPCLLMYELSIICYKEYKRNKKINLKRFILENKLSITYMFLTLTGYIILLILAIKRINLFNDTGITVSSKNNVFVTTILNYKYLLLTTFIIILTTIKKTKKSIKELIIELELPTFQIILAIISVAILKYSSAYYTIRATFYLFFSITIFDLSLINILIKNKNQEKRTIIISSILILIFSIITMLYYVDFNTFNKYRKESVIKQYKENKKVIKCPLYDNKYKYIFSNHLARYEEMYCDPTYIKYILNTKEDIKVINIKMKIR